MPFPRLNAAIERALEARLYAEPTEVQAAVLAAGTEGRDLLVSARTGSGKTVAYGLAFAPEIVGEAERAPAPAAPLALVVAPTRELALQVQTELEWLYAQSGARVVACVGGMDARSEARSLARGCHIVVGTPGRLKDHITRTQLDLSALRVAVLDEADEMLDLGFREDLGFILDAAPAARRTLLFSATFAREIVALARSYQRDALRIDMVDRSRPHEDIEYRAIRAGAGEEFGSLVNVLRAADSRALVFCATREGVKMLHARLQNHGFAAVALSGELSQAERTQALSALRDSRADVCVATDVAARGLDLPELDLVVHYDLPNGQEALLHRSGRTGRAGRKGVCALIVQPRQRRRAEQMLMGAKVAARWVPPPQAAEIRAADLARLDHDPAMAAPATEDETALAARLIASHGADAIAIALLRLHRARLPAPAEISAQAPDSTERGPAERREIGPTRWFRLNVGRNKNADPKWLLPLICRLGQVTRKDIGAIRIFEHDTRFELVAGAVDGFLAALVDAEMDDLSVTQEAVESVAPGASPAAVIETPRLHEAPRRFKPHGDSPRAPGGKPFRKPYSSKPHAGKPHSGSPYAGKPQSAKPYAKPAAKPHRKGQSAPRPERAAG